MDGPAPEPRDDDPIEAEVLHEGRLRSRIHWEWHGNRVRIRAPGVIPRAEQAPLV